MNPYRYKLRSSNEPLRVTSAGPRVKDIARAVARNLGYRGVRVQLWCPTADFRYAADDVVPINAELEVRVLPLHDRRPGTRV